MPDNVTFGPSGEEKIFDLEKWTGPDAGYIDPVNGMIPALKSLAKQWANSGIMTAVNRALTAMQRAEAAVASVTVGSTSALAFPAVDVRLPSAWSAAGAPTAYGAADYVDVDFLDAINDTDLGAWARKASAGSLGFEAISATRGFRRSIPQVGQLLLRTGSLVILDGLDLDVAAVLAVPRLFAVFTIAANNALEGVPSAVRYRQGRIFVTTSTGLYTINLATDEALRRDATGLYRYKGTLAERNAGKGWGLVSAAGAIVSADAKHVCARVLPGALLDGVGLPIPTILASTAAGVAVIHPNGAVCSLTGSAIRRALIVSDSRLWAVSDGASLVSVGPIPYATAALTVWRQTVYDHAATITKPALLLGTLRSVAPGAVSSESLGLTFLAEDPVTPSNGMAAYATKDYATGWMPGDIRGAWLCDAATGAITGSGELVTNGDFAASLTGWTAGTTGGTASAVWSGGGAVLTGDGTAYALLDQQLATVAGQSYLLVFSSSTSGVSCQVGATQGTASLASAAVTAGTNYVQFTATGATTWIRFARNTASGATIDTVSCKFAAPDRSYKGKGLIVNGTLTRAAVAAGADAVAWSGFSASNYLEQPYNPDLDLGAGDGAFVFWFENGNSGGDFFDRYTGAGSRVRALISSGKLSFVMSDGTNSVTAASTTDVASATSDGVYTMGVLVWRAKVAEVWINGVREASVSGASVGSLSSASTALVLGNRYDHANPLAYGSLALFRPLAYAPTPAQIARMYADERPLFGVGAKCLLGGTSSAVAALDYDEATGRLAVATGDGVSIFKGLSRVAYHDEGTLAATTSDAVRSVSLRAGSLLIGTTAEAGVYQDAVSGKEAIFAPPPQPAKAPFVASGVTADATPLDLAPRVAIGERELVTITATVLGRVYGATDSEAITYQRRATYYRNAAGNVTLKGSVQTIGTDTETTGTADATCNIDTTAQTVSVRVTGVAATRIAWTAHLAVTRISEESSYAA